MKFVGITACPAGIAHTYMAAEKLEQAAKAAGHSMRVETQGSIGVENELTEADIKAADAVIIAADKDIDLARFGGKRVIVASVADGIHKPDELMAQALEAPIHKGPSGGGGAGGASGGAGGGSSIYNALMNGVSYMIPFVVVGGLMIAVALGIGGEAVEGEGVVIPEDSFWKTVEQIGVIGFSLMVPILSGYIAFAIADRPGLAPGMITGVIANTGSFYDSEAGAGFLGAIVTGFAAGYVALWVKRWPVPKAVAPVMPIIVIPLVTTVIVSTAFILVIGKPIALIFEGLTSWLGGLSGGSVLLLGAILGAMIAIDMGGPINKTAFLFAAGLIPAGNTEIMGMVSVAICIPPIAMGIATFIRRSLFNQQEQDMGIASVFMGFFGVTEGAIPFAAADPLRVIPANVAGGAVGGAIAGVLGVTDSVPHGGFIVVLLGAVGNVGGWLIAAFAGIATSVVVVLFLKARGPAVVPDDPHAMGEDEPETEDESASAPPANVILAVEQKAAGTQTATRTGLLSYVDQASVDTDFNAASKEEAIDKLIELLSARGTVEDRDGLRAAVLAREEQMSTGLGNEIALPHGKTDSVSAAGVAFARSSEGIEWDSLDGTKAKLLFLITVPEHAAGDEHLRILAILSRKLVDDDYRAALLSASSKDEVMELLAQVE